MSLMDSEIYLSIWIKFENMLYDFVNHLEAAVAIGSYNFEVGMEFFSANEQNLARFLSCEARKKNRLRWSY